MRQAKLGASYKVKVFIGKGLTSHPDLSVSVIEDAEIRQNDIAEAYTGNSKGRKEGRTS